MSNQIQEFNNYREKMNERILDGGNLTIKRIFNLDTKTFQEGALSIKTKELMGLACSMVMRCDDCVKYHLGACHEAGITTQEIQEAFAIANLIGGTIVIPHLRKAVEYWDLLQEDAKN